MTHSPRSFAKRSDIANCMANTSALVEILPADFIAAVRPLAKLTRIRAGEEAVLSFDGTHLVVEFGGGGNGIPAKGLWPGEARISGKFMMSLIKVPPAGNPIVLKVVDDRFYCGTASTECQWQAKTAKQLTLPVNATLIDCLRISETYSDAEINAAGLSKLIRIAKEGRDARMNRAAEHMKDFGVTEADLHEFIRRRALNS